MTITEETRADATTWGVNMLDVPIGELCTAPDNLRYELGDLTELTATIRAVGILEPLVVIPAGDDPRQPPYEVLAGNRRLAAALAAGLKAVPCVIRYDLIGNEAARTEVMVVENLQRTGLNPVEEGDGYVRLAGLGLTQRDIAERVGCNQSHVSKRISIAGLPDQARDWVASGRLRVADAVEIAKAGDDAGAVVESVERLSGWQANENGPIRGATVAQALDELVTERKRAENIVRGEASGLPRHVDENGVGPHKYCRVGEMEPCKRADATHWWVGEHLSPKLVWCRVKPKPEKVTTTGGVEAQPVDYAAREQAIEAITDERRERRRETLAAAAAAVVDDDDVLALFHLAASVTMRHLADEGEILVVPTTGLALDDHPSPVALSLLILDSYGSVAAERLAYDEIIDADHAAYDALVELGYEFDEAEAAALPGIIVLDPAAEPEPEPERPVVIGPGTILEERVNEHGNVIDYAPQFDEAKTIDDVDADLWAEETHIGVDLLADHTTLLDLDGAVALPWKAYKFVGEQKLLGGIREHRGVAKLRQAIAYEHANDNRPAILTALVDRIGELEA